MDRFLFGFFLFGFLSSASTDSAFSDGTLECHLKSSKVASPKTDWAVCFSCLAWSVVSPPPNKSSTYRLRSISSTIFGCTCLQFLKCSLITAANKNGDGPSPNRALVNQRTSACLVLRSFNQWKRTASRSASQIHTCGNACLMSPAIATR